MPLEARPSLIVQSARIRYERIRQDKIDVALATANLILGGFGANNDTLSAVAHLFTEDEIKQIRNEQEERKQLIIQQEQLAKLRLKYHGRGSNDKSQGRGR